MAEIYSSPDKGRLGGVLIKRKEKINQFTMFKMKKIKTILRQAQNSFYYVDPTGLTPVSPLVKNGILLHKLRAQGPQRYRKTKRALSQELSLLTSGLPAIYANSVFWSYCIKLTNLVKYNFVDNFL